MKFTVIMSGVFAIAKAIPVVNNWIRDFVNEWINKGLHESDTIRETVNQEKKALDRAIAKAETDEDIKYLSITLRNLSTGKLPIDKNTSEIL